MSKFDLRNLKPDLKLDFKDERVRRIALGAGGLLVAGLAYAGKYVLALVKGAAVGTAKKVAVAGVATAAGLATGANASSPAPAAQPPAATADSAPRTAPAKDSVASKAAPAAPAPKAAPASAAPATPKTAAAPAAPTTSTAPAPAAPAVAQQPAPTPAAPARDTAGQIAIERETFEYGSGGRRDPFISLLTSDELRPTIADLRLVAVIHDRSGANTVAVLRDQATQQQYRVRRGAVVGRLRVVQIDVASVTLSIEEFGQNRTETLLLRDPNRTARTTP